MNPKGDFQVEGAKQVKIYVLAKHYAIKKLSRDFEAKV